MTTAREDAATKLWIQEEPRYVNVESGIESTRRASRSDRSFTRAKHPAEDERQPREG